MSTMGRNKPNNIKQRNNPVFKVVGGKAGKSKGKTQEVNSKLKHIARKFDQKAAVEKIDFQMQQNGVSLSGQSQQPPQEKKKVEAVQTKPDVPFKDIEDMIECFKEASASLAEEQSNVETKTWRI